MERTVSVNYPVLRQNKGILLNMYEKHHGRKIQHVHQYGKQEGIYQGRIVRNRHKQNCTIIFLFKKPSW